MLGARGVHGGVGISSTRIRSHLWVSISDLKYAHQSARQMDREEGQKRTAGRGHMCKGPETRKTKHVEESSIEFKGRRTGRQDLKPKCGFEADFVRPPGPCQRVGSTRDSVDKERGPARPASWMLSLASVQGDGWSRSKTGGSPPALLHCSLFLDLSLSLFLVPGTDSRFSLLVFNRSSQTSKGCCWESHVDP